MPVNQVVELVHQHTANPAIGVALVALGVSTLLDDFKHKIRIIDHLKPTIVGHANACRGNGGTSTLIDAARERSKERLFVKELVRVHIEVESGFWGCCRHTDLSRRVHPDLTYTLY